MNTTAVDIVLLPPDHIMDVAIELNDQLISANKTELNKSTYFPHISLLMGAVDNERLDELSDVITDISQQFESLPLEAFFQSSEYSALMITPTSELRRLQNMILEKTEDLVTANVTQDSLTDQNVGTLWIGYMNGYRGNDTGENFNPHITLGRGENPSISKVTSFTADQLVIGRLGDRCTVREILFTGSLVVGNHHD